MEVVVGDAADPDTSLDAESLLNSNKPQVDNVDEDAQQAQQSAEVASLMGGGSNITVSSGDDDTDDHFDDESLTKEKVALPAVCCGLAMTWLGCIMTALILIIILVLDDVEQSYRGSDVETLFTTRRSNNNTVQRLELASRLELSDTTIEDLANTTISSPQSQAMDWILQDGDLMGLTQLQQRFSLLTLMFASPDLMARATNFAHDYHECGWFHHKTHDDRILSCDAAHKLTAITIRDSQNKIQLATTLPREIGLLTHLKSLEIIDASLEGSLPSQVGLLTQLTHLHLGMNQLTANLPSEIWGLTSLQRLVLSDNQFLRGSLPSVSSMTHLQTLHWQSTQLSGTIPTQIGQWTKLSSLHLDQNQLTGTLPTQLGQLPLTSFLVRQNRLNGSLPTQLGAATMLQQLDLSWNQFDGSLPPQLFSNPFSVFSCHDNSLTGTLPTQMGQLQEIQEISLGENHFTGKIPTELWTLFSASSFYLDLESNSFLGTIPSSMCGHSKLAFDCAPPPSLCGCDCSFCDSDDTYP